MKKFTICVIVMVFALGGIKAQVSHTISVSGFAYDPNDLTINIGDTVIFVGSDSHPLVEVSEATWNANGNTALTGGFAFAEGSGTVVFDTAGVHYYVCTAHVASNGMKGKITVSPLSGIKDVSDAGASIYPLPLTGNELTVSFKNPVKRQLEVFVYDLAGNLRISEKGTTSDGKYILDCSNLPRGLFLLKMKSDGENIISKVVRE